MLFTSQNEKKLSLKQKYTFNTKSYNILAALSKSSDKENIFWK